MNALSEKIITEKIKDFQDWTYHENAIHTSLEFKNFKDAFSVMTRIAFEVEKLNHHPDWSNAYNSLHISLSTHDANGITDKDFELAKVIDELVS